MRSIARPAGAPAAARPERVLSNPYSRATPEEEINPINVPLIGNNFPARAKELFWENPSPARLKEKFIRFRGSEIRMNFCGRRCRSALESGLFTRIRVAACKGRNHRVSD